MTAAKRYTIRTQFFVFLEIPLSSPPLRYFSLVFFMFFFLLFVTFVFFLEYIPLQVLWCAGLLMPHPLFVSIAFGIACPLNSIAALCDVHLSIVSW